MARVKGVASTIGIEDSLVEDRRAGQFYRYFSEFMASFDEMDGVILRPWGVVDPDALDQTGLRAGRGTVNGLSARCLPTLVLKSRKSCVATRAVRFGA